MNAKFLFFSLKGRISRMWWWIGAFTVLVISSSLSILGFWLIGEDPTFYWNDKLPTPRTATVEAIVFVITLRLAFAVDIKRIHDRGRTAYLLVPIYMGELALIYLDSTGIDPFFYDVESPDFFMNQSAIFGFMLLFVVYVIWLIIELGLGKGTHGDSKYGPDPLENKTEPLT